MRIGLDARSINKKVCGVSRVSACLIQALSHIDSDNKYIVYTDSINFNLGRNFKIIPSYCSRNNPLHDFKFYSILKSDELDLYHAMHSWLPVLIPKRLKTVVTIHDLVSITDAGFFIKYRPFQGMFRVYFKYLTSRAVKRADAIVTVSNYCKGELIRNFPVSDGKVNVIYNASGIKGPYNYGKNSRIVKGNYLLYIGNCRSYKNVHVLIEGFAVFVRKTKDSSLNLVIAGNDECDVIKERAKRLGIGGRVVFFTGPSDEELTSLYANSTAFILPSKYEGFGIPVLEAMSLGVPVIISDASALVEVAGDAALIFKKDCPDDLALSIQWVISDSILRHALIEKGLKRAEDFSWLSSAEKVKNLYQRILSSGG